MKRFDDYFDPYPDEDAPIEVGCCPECGEGMEILDEHHFYCESCGRRYQRENT